MIKTKKNKIFYLFLFSGNIIYNNAGYTDIYTGNISPTIVKDKTDEKSSDKTSDKNEKINSNQDDFKNYIPISKIKTTNEKIQGLYEELAKFPSSEYLIKILEKKNIECNPNGGEKPIFLLFILYNLAFLNDFFFLIFFFLNGKKIGVPSEHERWITFNFWRPENNKNNAIQKIDVVVNKEGQINSLIYALPVWVHLKLSEKGCFCKKENIPNFVEGCKEYFKYITEMSIKDYTSLKDRIYHRLPHVENVPGFEDKITENIQELFSSTFKYFFYKEILRLIVYFSYTTSIFDSQIPFSLYNVAKNNLALITFILWLIFYGAACTMLDGVIIALNSIQEIFFAAVINYCLYYKKKKKQEEEEKKKYSVKVKYHPLDKKTYIKNDPKNIEKFKELCQLCA